MKKEQSHINKGFSLVEILVALAIFLIFSTAILGLSSSSDKQLKRSTNSERASALADEAFEAVRNIRDENFSNLVNGTYGLVASTTGFEWVLDPSPDTNDIFTRTVEISDGNNANQKKVDVAVTWDDQISLANNFSATTYLTNWRAFVPDVGLTLKKVIVNYYTPQKTLEDFAPFDLTPSGTTTVLATFDVNTVAEDPIGTFTFETLGVPPGNYDISETVDSNYTQTFNPSCEGGNVTLAPSTPVECIITNEQKYATLKVLKVVDNIFGGNKTISDFAPYTYGANVLAIDTATKVEPGTYTIGETVVANYEKSYAGDCNSLGQITLTENQNKICTIINTQLSGGGSGPTGTWVNPNSSDSIIDLSGNNDGRKIFVAGNYAYVVRANTTANFSIINITNTALPTLSSTINLTGTPSNVIVYGNYAYVSSDNNSQELQVINISNPASPTLVASYDAAGTGNALGLGLSGNNLVMTRQNVGGFSDFVVLDILEPLTPTLLGQLETGAPSYESVVSGIYAYVASGDNAAELRIYNISNPATPVLVGTYDAPTNTDAITLAYQNDVVLLGQGSTVYKVNVSDRSLPTLSGSYAIGGTVNDISIANTNNYAFIANANATAELTILNYAPATPALVGVFNGAASYTGVAYDSTKDRAFMTSTNNAGEFQVIKP